MIFFRALLPSLAEILTKQKFLPMLSIGNPIFKKIQDPDPDPDHDQNRISSSSSRYLTIKKIWKLLLQNCGRYRADKQTNRQSDKQTDRQTNETSNILSKSKISLSNKTSNILDEIVDFAK